MIFFFFWFYERDYSLIKKVLIFDQSTPIKSTVMRDYSPTFTFIFDHFHLLSFL